VVAAPQAAGSGSGAAADASTAPVGGSDYNEDGLR
jgi:hypothetical protein